MDDIFIGNLNIFSDSLLGRNLMEENLTMKHYMKYEGAAHALPPINEDQWAAIEHCLLKPFTLIQGPPGTSMHK